MPHSGYRRLLRRRQRFPAAAPGPGVTVGDRPAGPGPTGAAPEPPAAASHLLHHRVTPRPLHPDPSSTHEAALAARTGGGDSGDGGSGGSGDARDADGRAAAIGALHDAHNRT